ncbi:adenosylcobinamide amidohydrolase [Desulfitispora alkaliphila]|uniref:adenosylcobinamide amidohydrolase n=1 Tax=Desulfitispora alkaliphila TaxID=622674 RepID=UPI003D1DAC69
MEIEWGVDKNALWIKSKNPLRAISSGVLGQGLLKVTGIINKQVHKDYSSNEPVKDLRQACVELNLDPENSCGLLTAVKMKDVVWAQENRKEFWVKVFATAGVTNAAEAGKRNFYEEKPGTINIIVLTNASLSDGALVNSVITMTEAKTLVLLELGVKDVETGNPASGTTSDAIVIATTGTGPRVDFAGTATEFGQVAASLVKYCIHNSLKRGGV